MPRSLVYRCPTCDRRLAPVQGMLYSTHVVRRTCRGCGDQWQILIAIVIAPRRSALAWFDFGTFARIGGRGVKSG